MLVGGVNFGSTVVALLFVEKLGRRTMLLIGFALMCVFQLLTGIFEAQKMDTA